MEPPHDDACENNEVDRRPCFFKIMFPNNLVKLRIPPAFKKHIANEKRDRATLRTVCGTWNVKLLEDGSDIYLSKGWPKFVKDHSLGDFEFLVFKYNGNLCFEVVIYDKLTMCPRNYPSASASDEEPAPFFASSLPHFTCTMKAYNIGSKSVLTIPRPFSRKHLRFTKQKTMFLKNSMGTSWEVSVNPWTRKKYLIIHGGWKAFADFNKLKVGDGCLFELVDQNTFQVHIVK